jgi:predicted MFS family arabinose efflux permease
MPFRTRAEPVPILFLAVFAAQAGFLVLTPILPVVAGDFGVSTAMAGGLRVASGLAGSAVALTLGRTAPRLGLRDRSSSVKPGASRPPPRGARDQ